MHASHARMRRLHGQPQHRLPLSSLALPAQDIVCRYAHQTGHYVERRFGWDCHGLPIEFEIDKMHKINSRQDVLDMGIDKYNAACRSIVMRFSGEWEKTVKRVGRWIDFDNDYKTMNISFMESCWWVFGRLHEQGLVYRGFKVMAYSCALNTPLSNFEVQQNYKTVDDPAVVCTFPLKDEPNVCFVAWTTTPWTLPSNLALCVNPAMEYVKIKEKESGKIYILMATRLVQLFPELGNAKKKKDAMAKLEELDRFPGSKLKGTHYIPPFDYFEPTRATGSFQVITGDFVTDDAGTGIVHCAPAFGEEDYKACMANGVIRKGESLVCPIDENGRFTEEVGAKPPAQARTRKHAHERACSQTPCPLRTRVFLPPPALGAIRQSACPSHGLASILCLISINHTPTASPLMRRPSTCGPSPLGT